MLNKELINSQSPLESVIMQVGYYAYTPDEGYREEYWGYNPAYVVGSLDKVPYWGDKSCYLKDFHYYFRFRESYTLVTFSKYVPYVINISANGKIVDSFKDYDVLKIRGDFFNLKDSQGTSVAITFDPPPDGYL